jgi:hypothetical protein
MPCQQRCHTRWRTEHGRDVHAHSEMKTRRRYTLAINAAAKNRRLQRNRPHRKKKKKKKRRMSKCRLFEHWPAPRCQRTERCEYSVGKFRQPRPHRKHMPRPRRTERTEKPTPLNMAGPRRSTRRTAPRRNAIRGQRPQPVPKNPSERR